MRDTKETTINYVEEDGELHVYSNVRRHVNAMRKLVSKNTEVCVVRECEDGGVFFRMPAEYLRLPRPKRRMSDAAVEAARSRMSDMRKKASDKTESLECDT